MTVYEVIYIQNVQNLKFYDFEIRVFIELLLCYFLQRTLQEFKRQKVCMCLKKMAKNDMELIRSGGK